MSLLITLSLAATPPAGHTAPAIEQNSQRIEMAEEQLDMLEQRLSEVESGRVEELERSLASAGQDLRVAERRLDDTEARLGEVIDAQWQASIIARIGATLLMVGLMLEVVGALLLGSGALASPQERILTLEPRPGLFDLDVVDKENSKKLRFLEVIGAILLSAGFLLQFCGTAAVVSLSPGVLIAVILAGGAVAGATAWGLLGMGGQKQTRSEKLAVLKANVGVAASEALQALGLGVLRCDCCRRTLPIPEACVGWLQQKNGASHPFLYPPYNMRVGHEACLQTDADLQLRHPPDEAPSSDRMIVPAVEFLTSHGPRMKAWFQARRKDIAGRRNAPGPADARESALDRTVQRLSNGERA